MCQLVQAKKNGIRGMRGNWLVGVISMFDSKEFVIIWELFAVTYADDSQ